MLKSKRTIALLAVALTMALGVMLTPAPQTNAADHGDAPTPSAIRSTDIADVYAFLDPNDNTKLVLIFTIGGFIVPGEAANFGFFDPNVRYRLDLETTGDPRPDHAIIISFSPRVGSASAAQTATIQLPFGSVFTAPTTRPSTGATANPPVITTDAASGVSFFAGLVDDPFFFDIPGFNGFVGSVLAGSPNPSLLSRGRDSFAGYNITAIALSIPVASLRLQRTSNNPTGTGVGVAGSTQLRENTNISRAGVQPSGGFKTIDRMGNPGVNVALVPFDRKDEYNFARPLDDARGQFAGDIVGTLTALGTNATNIGILASVAVARGDFLRLDTSVANSGTGGGNNTGAGFPNGRRLRDDVIDTILFFVANQTAVGDSVSSNDLTFRDTFPFLAAPQQARAAGTTDDNTRN
jgi:hypothetical protein